MNALPPLGPYHAAWPRAALPRFRPLAPTALTPLRSPHRDTPERTTTVTAPLPEPAPPQRATDELTDADRSLIARAIIECGRLRRSEIPYDPPPPGSLAAKIVAAAKKARGEE
jgi:hypothetical protein